MAKKILLILLVLLCSSLVMASENEENLLNEYEKMFGQGEYELIVNELEPLVNSENNHFGTASSYLKAVNILADSFLCLNKYTQANLYYWSSSEGLNTYGEYYYNLLSNISLEKGYDISQWEWQNIHERRKHYTGWMGANPLPEETLYAILAKLFDDDTMEEKETYFREMVQQDKNGDWLTKLTKFCAGDISLEDLLIEVPANKKEIVNTYAGLSLELKGETKRAKKLYETALSENWSDRIELILAANRLGLFTLEKYFEDNNGVIETKYVNAIKASSSKIEGKNVYSVSNLVDGNVNTAWVEGKDGSGINEWIKISFGDIYTNKSHYNFSDKGREIKIIKIINGYAKSKKLYEANNRVKEIEINFDDSFSIQAELKDGTLKPQKIELEMPIEVKDIKITILDVYRGTKYDDTCISEISFE